MKCILCNSRKGKRRCPAKGTLICAPCCGRMRVVEIPCPPDCVYLTEGHGHQAAKKYVHQLRQEEDTDRRMRLYRNLQTYRPLIDRVEVEILRYGQGLRSFQDRHVLEAVRLLRKTYRSEDRGVIYEQTSPDPMVSSLIRAVQEMLEKTREELQSSLRVSDLLNCLEVVESEIDYHLNQPAGGEPYLTFIRKNHPDVTPTGSDQNLIVL